MNTGTQLTSTSIKCEIPESSGGKDRKISLISDLDIQTGILDGCVLDYARPVVDDVVIGDVGDTAPREGGISITVRGVRARSARLII